MAETRPPLTTDLTSVELLRWYWLKDELDGRPAPPSQRRPPAAQALPEPLTPATRIPAGQRCTQQLRRFFPGQVGPALRFDAPMREHLAAGQGCTPVDAREAQDRTPRATTAGRW